MKDKTDKLPLRCKTPDRWAEIALSDKLKLLNDHAHLEKKAATNALDLLLLWPSAESPPSWLKKLTAIAKDEVSHLATVVKLLDQRGGAMSRGHRSQYAHDLRGLVSRGEGPKETIDRLLISALIEARSAERFEILGRCSDDAALLKLYRGLWASEQGHFRIFYELAGLAAEISTGARYLERRWDEFLDGEAKIIQSQPAKAQLHSWPN